MSAYKLYLDKNNTFQCSVQLEGASEQNAKARLVVEARGKKLLYEGEVKPNGECLIQLNKLSELFKAEDMGHLKLEVIADDAYFLPWESECTFDLSKKVFVEVASQPEPVKKPAISVNIVTEDTKEMHRIVDAVVKTLGERGVSSTNIKKNKSTVTKLINEQLKTATYTHNLNTLITNVVQKL